MDTKLESLIARIETFSDGAKKFEISDDEKTFLAELIRQSEAIVDADFFNIDRKSNGTLNVCYKTYQIGRIKLTGRKYEMQVLTHNDVDWFNIMNVQEGIKKIPRWITRIKQLTRKY